MTTHERVSQGILAGLLSAGALVAFFFVADLVRLEPLSTPTALQQTFLGPGGTTRTFPVESEVATLLVFVARLVSFTILHFLAFALLGIGAALVLCGRPLGACALSGAIYGVVACSAVFYGSILATGASRMAALPGPGAVLFANLLAGLIMGTYLGLARRDG